MCGLPGALTAAGNGNLASVRSNRSTSDPRQQPKPTVAALTVAAWQQQPARAQRESVQRAHRADRCLPPGLGERVCGYAPHVPPQLFVGTPVSSHTTRTEPA